MGRKPAQVRSAEEPILQCCDDEERGGLRRKTGGIDYEIVEARIVDVLLEMGAHVAAAREIVPLQVREGSRGRAVEQPGDAFCANFQRCDEPNMQAARDIAGDEMCGATDEDHAADVCQLEDGLGNLVFTRPERRMQPDEFTDHGISFGDTVFGQKRREALRQAVVCQRVG